MLYLSRTKHTYSVFNYHNTVQAHAEPAQETDTSAEAAMHRIAKGLPTGSGIIALAVANNQAHAAGCHIRIEPRQASDSNIGTTVSLWVPAP